MGAQARSRAGGCTRGRAAGRSATRASCSGMLRPVCAAAGSSGQMSLGMPVQQEAGTGKISRFLQGRSDPLALLVAYKLFDTGAI